MKERKRRVKRVRDMVVDDMAEEKKVGEKVMGFVGALLRRDGVHKVRDVLGL